MKPFKKLLSFVNRLYFTNNSRHFFLLQCLAIMWYSIHDSSGVPLLSILSLAKNQKAVKSVRFHSFKLCRNEKNMQYMFYKNENYSFSKKDLIHLIPALYSIIDNYGFYTGGSQHWKYWTNSIADNLSNILNYPGTIMKGK